LTPVFGGTISENPTISIVPIEGEEFTRRLLTPSSLTRKGRGGLMPKSSNPGDLLLY
jgi:hypothetical protein